MKNRLTRVRLPFHGAGDSAANARFTAGRFRNRAYPVFYFAMALVVTAQLTLILNIIFLGVMLYTFHRYQPGDVSGGAIMEELTQTGEGYELSGTMQELLSENSQWAMLLDENGDVVWSYDKPGEIKDSYSRSDIARMSKWYLKDYPVRMRVWEDRIMVTGAPKKSTWKYTLEFPILWIEFMVKGGIWMLPLNFLWVLLLAAFFTRRWSASRERARLEWISGVSHDIRTPLSMVMGYAAALEKSAGLSEEERRQMSVIKRQGLVIKELVEDLNLTSALEYSMQTLRVEEVRPAAVLREVAAAFLNDAKEDELEIGIEISKQAEQTWIRADRKLLARALRNLFHNSLQHSGQKKTTVIRLHMWREKSRCFIRFSDNGAGYSPEVLHRLRNRKSRRATQNIKGLGIVYKTVCAHGGRIRFENNEAGGSFCEMWFRAVK